MQTQSTPNLCACGCGEIANQRYVRWHHLRNRPHKSIEYKFWSKVNKGGPIPQHCPELGPCWIWIGNKGHKWPYGVLVVQEDGRFRALKAHRISWSLHNGTIPNSLFVCHKCDNPPCVRPDHLFLGTTQDNMDDMMKKGRLITRRGEDTPWHKVTEEQVREIRQRYESEHITQKALALDYGVTHITISDITRGNTWRHLL